MKMLQVYTNFIEDMERLTDAEKGRLFVAMLQYAADEAEPDLSGNEGILWPSVRKDLDAQWASYRKRCEQNKENIAKRYESYPETTNRNKNKNKNKNKNTFSLERERENTTDEIKRLLDAM